MLLISFKLTWPIIKRLTFFLLKHRISFVSLVVKLLFFKSRHDVLCPPYLAHEKNQRLA